MAEEAGLDLVEVATKARPHVCRIMDYGQYKYEQAKRQKEAKKKQKQIVVKEVQIRPRTDEHDYQVKLNHARDFLSQGFKVKVNCRFKGRENAHREIGREKIERLAADLASFGTLDFQPRQEGRNLMAVFTPDAERVRKSQEEKRAKAKDEQGRGQAIQADEEREDQAQQGVQEPHFEQEDPEEKAPAEEVDAGQQAG